MTAKEQLALIQSYRAAGGTGSYISLLKEAKQYGDGGEKDKTPKELSGPTIRGKQYPVGTVVVNDPELYKRNQDSLKLYNQAEQGQKKFEKYFDWTRYGKILPEDEVFNKINRLNPTGDAWEGASGRLITGEYQGEINKKTGTGWGYNPNQDNIREYQRRNLPIKPIGWKPELNYGEKYNPEELYDYHAVYKKPVDMVYQPFVNRMTPKGMPIPTVTPNQGLRPDAIYRERPDGHYKQGLSISHRTDPLGRWAAQINTKPSPGVDGRLTTFPEGTHKVEYKFENGGTTTETTPNPRIQPDVIYGMDKVYITDGNPTYKHPGMEGVSISHFTDGLGRWAAKFNPSTTPEIQGRLSTPNPAGDYTTTQSRGKLMAMGGLTNPTNPPVIVPWADNVTNPFQAHYAIKAATTAHQKYQELAKKADYDNNIQARANDQLYRKMITPADNLVPIQKDSILNLSHKNSDGSVGIRHGSKIQSEIVQGIAKKAFKYNVPLEEALAIGLRESNLQEGADNKNYDPMTLYQSWSSIYDSRLPLRNVEHAIKNNLIPKDKIFITKYGYEASLKDVETPGNVKAYSDYLNNFQFEDSTVFEPFDKEMKFLSENMGQKYNSREKERSSRMNVEREALRQNPDFMNYARKFYK